MTMTMRYYYGPLTTIGNLEPGAIFETNEGVRAVKSEYFYDNGGTWQVILLDSGEYGHFKLRNQEPCRELILECEDSDDE